MPALNNTTLCFCGSQLPFVECCEPFILEKAFPPTAEKLMRSRYSAFAVADSSYLMSSAHPTLRKQQNEEDIKSWALENKWQKLEIISTKSGQPDDEKGEVEFKAYYLDSEGIMQIHHERSTFLKEDDLWLYHSGTTPPKTVVKTQNRNDLCACGSGKKYKNCHGR